MLNVLLVGLGARGRYWAEVLRRSPDCRAAGYVDPNPTRWLEPVLTLAIMPPLPI